MPVEYGGNQGGAGAGGVAVSAGAASQSTGTIVFSNSNSVSFGLNAGTLTASIPVPFDCAVSTMGNTIGTTGAITNRVYFVGGNNVTLSVSTQVGGFGTITISGPNTAPETPFGISAGTQSVSTGTMVFSNSNNFTFGMSGSSRITASYTAPVVSNAIQTVGSATGSGTATSQFAAHDHVHAGVGQFQISGNTSNTSNIVFGSLVLAGGTNITLSQVSAAGGATVTISGGNQTVQTQGLVNSVSIIGNTSGTTSAGGGSLVLAGGPNITLSCSTAAGGITVSVSAGADAATISQFFPVLMASSSRKQLANSNVIFWPVSNDVFVTATRGIFFLTNSISTSSNSSFAGTLSAHFGIYTRNASTLSLASSGSATYAWTNTSNNSTNLLSGLKGFSVPINVNMTPGNYWFGFLSVTASANANWLTLSNMFYAHGNNPYNGFFMSDSTGVSSSQQSAFGMGNWASVSASAPNSAAISDILNINNEGFPAMHLENVTA